MSQLPARAGAAFKPDHFRDILSEPQSVGFFEVHAENYMGAGGPPHRQLARIRDDYALSLHGVGLSIGSAGTLDPVHLDRLKALCERYEPQSFSEHLAWSTHESAYFNDLLPLPYTEETLERVIAHVDQVQTALGRRMLLENPATYILFADSTIPETEFLDEVSSRTGCGFLLDINNVFVSAQNHKTDPRAYLRAFPLARVGEIHLAGHDEIEDANGDKVLIDAHGSPVSDPVWALYREVVSWTGTLPTLIEWDNDVPSWAVLRREADLAQAILDNAQRRAA